MSGSQHRDWSTGWTTGGPNHGMLSDISFLQNAHTGSGAHTARSSVGNVSCNTRGKAVGA